MTARWERTGDIGLRPNEPALGTPSLNSMEVVAEALIDDHATLEEVVNGYADFAEVIDAEMQKVRDLRDADLGRLSLMIVSKLVLSLARSGALNKDHVDDMFDGLLDMAEGDPVMIRLLQNVAERAGHIAPEPPPYDAGHE